MVARSRKTKSLERIGISLDSTLLSMFDKLIAGQGYESRSEAIRDLVRQQLSREFAGDPKAEGVAVVVLVYDHHAANIAEKLIRLQHSHILHAISSLHVHLGAHDCLEIIVLRGRVGRINKMGESLVSMKGVRLGRINLVATETP
ncbi:MAG: nickel-responsive transcriptional regulator NikR [Phycisphaerales bacterium]|nr:MAG: nickel-responsive transcriptional regulator NikR [Phycisphaerales bacterium]